MTIESEQTEEFASLVSVMAANGIAEVIRSAFGPRAMNKMMVDTFGRIRITNDGATVLRELNVQAISERHLWNLISVCPAPSRKSVCCHGRATGA